jgi:hypothetical protein
MSRRESGRGAIVASLWACVAVGCGEGPDAAADAFMEHDAEEDGSDAAPSGLRIEPVVEVLDGVSVATPPPGMRVLIEVVYEDGPMELVDVATDEDGVVALRYHDESWGLVAPPPVAAVCPTKCTDVRTSFTGHHWSGGAITWRYRDAGRPAALGQTDTVNALVYAAAGPPTARDACGLPDNVTASSSYQGLTNTAPGISLAGGSISCASFDFNNVAGWADLPGSVLGVACTWSWIGGQAIDSDMLYDNSRSWYTGNTAPAGCGAQYSLRGVATHEFGHAYGLGHSPGDSCNLTMYPATGPCNDGPRNFGLGDVIGLEGLY